MKSAIAIIVALCFGMFAAFAVLDETARVIYVVRYNLAFGRSKQPEMIDHPFLTVAMKPNFRESGIDSFGEHFDFSTNSFGYRTPEFRVQKPAGTYRIVVVGGSAGVAAARDAQTFENLLGQRLNRMAQGAVRYEVINAAVPYYTSTQELFLTAAQVIYWQPDMVIVYDGWNDAEVSSRADWQPNWNYRNDRVMAVLRQQEHPLLSQFFIFHLVYDRLHHVSFAPTFAFHPAAVEVYAANLRSLLAVLKDRGVVPVLVFQPSLLLKSNPVPEERANLTRKDAQTWYGVNLEIMRKMLPLEAHAMTEVAHLTHVRSADFTAVFDGAKGKTFNDLVHQTDLGNEVIAEHLFVLIRPLLPQSAAALSVHGGAATRH